MSSVVVSWLTAIQHLFFNVNTLLGIINVRGTFNNSFITSKTFMLPFIRFKI